MDDYGNFLKEMEIALDKASKSSNAVATGRSILLQPESAFGKDIQEAKRLHDDPSARAAKQVQMDIEVVERLIMGGSSDGV